MRNLFVSQSEALAEGYTHEARVWGVPYWAKDLGKYGPGSFAGIPKFLPLIHYARAMNALAQLVLETLVMISGNYFLSFQQPVNIIKPIEKKVEFL